MQLYIAYRDHLGMFVRPVLDGVISFCDGKAYFTTEVSNAEISVPVDMTIPIEAIVSIGTDN